MALEGASPSVPIDPFGAILSSLFSGGLDLVESDDTLKT